MNSLLVFSQSESSLIDSVKFARQILENPMASDPNSGACFDGSLKVGSPSEVLSCSSKSQPSALSDFSTFKLKFQSLSELPPVFKNNLPGSILDGNTHGGVSVVVSLPNDNKLFGLWGILFGDDGDDFGYTHGSKIEVSRTSSTGVTTTLLGSSDLYTKRIYWSPDNHVDAQGVSHVSQAFTNDNLVKVVMDNKASGKLLYWKLGAGWQRLDSKNFKSPLLASGQQLRWHKTLQDTIGPDSAMTPINKSSEDNVRDSYQLEALLGIQNNFVFGSSCRIKTYAEVSGNLAPIGSTYLKAEAGTYFFYQKPKSRTAFFAGGSGSATKSLTATTYAVEPQIGVQRGRATLSLIYSQSFNELDNYAGLNDKRQPRDRHGQAIGTPYIDPTMTIKLGFIIGRMRPGR